MADKKISALTASTTPLAGTEVLPIVQGGSTVKVAVSDLTAGRAVSASSVTSTGNSTFNTAANVGWRVGARSDNAISAIYPTAVTPDSTNYALQASSTITYLNSPGATSLAVSDNAIATATATALTLPNANLVIGTANKGIDFSANANAPGMTSELLNDYEEGTWTPTAVSTGGAITAYTSAATYTKVGRLVYINGYVQLTNPGTASGAMIIDSIPYINGNSGVSGKGQQMALVRESENTGATYLGFMLSNSTQLRISTLTGGSISWVANDQYSFSLCYYTT